MGETQNILRLVLPKLQHGIVVGQGIVTALVVWPTSCRIPTYPEAVNSRKRKKRTQCENLEK
jgi:hypothetical protein